MTLCAYCKQHKPTTREHVIPAFMHAFQRETEDSLIGWNEVAKRMIAGEGKVKDVCAQCNNSLLGRLDAFGKELLEASGILVQNFTRLTLTLRYDYDLLLRWLLKISFNSARTDGIHSPLFDRHIPFILGVKPAPKRHQLACLAYLAAPVRLDDSQVHREPFVGITKGSPLLNPFVVRIAYGVVPGEYRYTLRVNIFGPLVFSLLMFNEHVSPGDAAAAIRRLVKLRPGSKEVSPRLRLLDIAAGPDTWLNLYEHQVARVQALERGG